MENKVENLINTEKFLNKCNSKYEIICRRVSNNDTLSYQYLLQNMNSKSFKTIWITNEAVNIFYLHDAVDNYEMNIQNDKIKQNIGIIETYFHDNFDLAYYNNKAKIAREKYFESSDFSESSESSSHSIKDSEIPTINKQIKSRKQTARKSTNGFQKITKNYLLEKFLEDVMLYKNTSTLKLPTILKNKKIDENVSYENGHEVITID